MNRKRINGSSLEQIMHEVLSGMAEFTQQACRSSHAADLEVISIEKGHGGRPEAAVVIPFAVASRKA